MFRCAARSIRKDDLCKDDILDTGSVCTCDYVTHCCEYGRNRQFFNGEKTVQVQPKNTAAIMAPLTATHEEISAGQYFNVQH